MILRERKRVGCVGNGNGNGEREVLERVWRKVE